MEIDKEKCIGCGECRPYCTVSAIAIVEWGGKCISEVNQEECVECGVCLRASICPTEAIYMQKLKWPRLIRAEFSNPTLPHSSTRVLGRGTQEMKTNDVSGRFLMGFTGVGIEVGRPGVGATLEEIQAICMAVAEVEIEFEPLNPVTSLMADGKTGKLKEDILNEKVLSAIIEFIVPNDQLNSVLERIKAVSKKINTVFSLDLMSRVNEDGSIPVVSIAKNAGFIARPNTKTNIGLGRPLKEEQERGVR